MSRILAKDTKPELKVRRILRDLGYRYRLHVKNLPGRPDITLRKYLVVIFVHGCFWHLHSGCRDGTIPKSRAEYWHEKLLKNKTRDKKNIQVLRRKGWKVLRLWECEIEKAPEDIAKKIVKILSKNSPC